MFWNFCHLFRLLIAFIQSKNIQQKIKYLHSNNNNNNNNNNSNNNNNNNNSNNNNNNNNIVIIIKASKWYETRCYVFYQSDKSFDKLAGLLIEICEETLRSIAWYEFTSFK